jgi:DNA-binding GntR family transcriptional regulator
LLPTTENAVFQCGRSSSEINARIQLVRWLDMTERLPETQSQYKHIVAALRKRDHNESERLISEHIAHRLDQVIEKVERSYGRIFVRSQRLNSSESV